jgi:integrase
METPPAKSAKNDLPAADHLNGDLPDIVDLVLEMGRPTPRVPRLSTSWSRRPRIMRKTPVRRTRAAPTPRTGATLPLGAGGRASSRCPRTKGHRALHQRLCLRHRRQRCEARRPSAARFDHRAAPLRPRLEFYPARLCHGPRRSPYLLGARRHPPQAREAAAGERSAARRRPARHDRHLGRDLRGLRDRSILLLGFAGGLRRSEIVGLDVAREEKSDGAGWVGIFPDKGVLVTLRSKTGWREVEVGRGSSDLSCPVVALETWIRYGRIARGPLFRRIFKDNKTIDIERLSDKHVARLVKQTALAAGVRADLPEARSCSPGTCSAPASPLRPTSRSDTCRSSSAMPRPPANISAGAIASGPTSPRHPGSEKVPSPARPGRLLALVGQDDVAAGDSTSSSRAVTMVRLSAAISS